MAEKVWIGTTDTDFNVAGNWSASGVPATGDTLTFDQRAIRACLLNMTQAAKAFPTVKLMRGFAYSLGGAGAAFAPANGITDLLVHYGGQGVCYVNTGITRVHVDATNTNENMLVLDSSAVGDDITNLTIVSGKVVLAATASFAASSRVSLNGAAAKLTIASGVTYSGAAGVLAIKDGTVLVNASQSTINCDGGTVTLGADGGTQTLTLLEQTGGTFYWESSGTITTVRCSGGTFYPNRTGQDVAKTLTNGFVYPGAVVDLSAAYNLTVTNGWYTYGASPLWPSGTPVNRV